VAGVATQLEVFEQTLHRWRGQYGGLKAEDAKRLKELERENTKLKRIVAEQLLSREHPRWGYRRAWASLREQGFAANRKKIQRLWREEGLRVPGKPRKRQRLGTSTVPIARLRAERPDQV
jgi:transposase InsO family protein